MATRNLYVDYNVNYFLLPRLHELRVAPEGHGVHRGCHPHQGMWTHRLPTRLVTSLDEPRWRYFRFSFLFFLIMFFHLFDKLARHINRNMHFYEYFRHSFWGCFFIIYSIFIYYTIYRLARHINTNKHFCKYLGVFLQICLCIQMCIFVHKHISYSFWISFFYEFIQIFILNLFATH